MRSGWIFPRRCLTGVVAVDHILQIIFDISKTKLSYEWLFSKITEQQYEVDLRAQRYLLVDGLELLICQAEGLLTLDIVESGKALKFIDLGFREDVPSFIGLF